MRQLILSLFSDQPETFLHRLKHTSIAKTHQPINHCKTNKVSIITHKIPSFLRKHFPETTEFTPIPIHTWSSIFLHDSQKNDLVAPLRKAFPPDTRVTFSFLSNTLSPPYQIDIFSETPFPFPFYTEKHLKDLFGTTAQIDSHIGPEYTESSSLNDSIEEHIPIGQKLHQLLQGLALSLTSGCGVIIPNGIIPYVMKDLSCIEDPSTIPTIMRQRLIEIGFFPKDLQFSETDTPHLYTLLHRSLAIWLIEHSQNSNDSH